MEFRILGPVEIRGDNSPIAVPTAMHRCVLAVLALEVGRPVHADTIVDRVWGERAPQKPRETLARYVGALREAIARAGGQRGWLPEARSELFVLDIDPDLVDYHRFTALVQAARKDSRPEVAVKTYQQALDLWHGTALANLTSDWAVRYRGILEDKRLDAMSALLDLQPAGTGNVVSGTVLGSVVQASAIHGDVHLHHAPPTIGPRQLPGAIPNFVGRARELEILTTQLDTASEGTVVITSIGGTAGIGKTTLAVHWGRQHLDRFPDGQLYVDLRGFAPGGTPMKPPEAVRGFLDAFQVPVEKIPTDLDAQAALYRSLVEDKRMLIVLDNARDTDQVRPLLPGSPTCLVLVTSRQQLASLIACEQATHITLDFLTLDEARELLAKFLGAERVHAEADAVDDLIQRCVRLPIALTIAAARAVTNPRTPLSALVTELAELSTGDSQRTDIRAVFSWSYTALSPEAAGMFRLLGLHPGPDTSLHAAASLAGIPTPRARTLLTELTRAHLLDEHTPGRYRFHDLLRAYASEQATDDEPEPQQRAAIHRVLDHYLHTGVAAARHLHPHRDPLTVKVPQPGAVPHEITDYPQALEWFTAEHATLLAATDHAARTRWDTHTWQLPWTLADFLNRQGHWHDFVATQQTALAAAGRLNDRDAQARTHRLLGGACTRLGRHAEARTHLQQALTLYRDLGDRTGQAHTHRVLSWVCEQQGHYPEALTHAQHALELYRATGHHAGEASALNALGWDHARLGHYQQALDLLRELGDRDGEAAALDSLGYAHHHLGHHTQALTHYQQALTLYRELGDPYYEADTLTHLGDTHHATGDHPDARDAWQQALTIFEDLGHPDAEHVRAKLADLDRTGQG